MEEEEEGTSVKWQNELGIESAVFVGVLVCVRVRVCVRIYIFL